MDQRIQARLDAQVDQFRSQIREELVGMGVLDEDGQPVRPPAPPAEAPSLIPVAARI